MLSLSVCRDNILKDYWLDDIISCFHPFELTFAESSNKVLVGAMRLERITYGLKDRYSNHLSYTPTEYSVVPKEGIEPSCFSQA